MLKFKAILGLFISGLIIYSSFWYSIGLNIERQIVEEMDNLREQGVRVEHSPPELTGFPYRLEITLKNLSLDAKKFGWHLQSNSATAIGHIWMPNTWYLRLRGTKTKALDGALTLKSEDSLASIKWSDSGTMQFSIDLSSAEASGKIFSSSTISADKAELHIMTPARGTEKDSSLLSPLIFRGALRIAGASDDKSDYPAMDRGEILFALHGSGLDRWSKGALSNWRDDGGTLEISALSIEWEQAEIDGSASLTLDENLKPLGAATLNVKNARTMLNTLENLQLITDRPDNNDGSIALMAQMGTLTANGKKIATLKSIKP